MLDLLTAKELARELPIGEQKIRTLAKSLKDFPCIKCGCYTYYIKDQVEEWLREQSKNGIRI